LTSILRISVPTLVGEYMGFPMRNELLLKASKLLQKLYGDETAAFVGFLWVVTS
jgi:hypothetical protein